MRPTAVRHDAAISGHRDSRCRPTLDQTMGRWVSLDKTLNSVSRETGDYSLAHKLLEAAVQLVSNLDYRRVRQTNQYPTLSTPPCPFAVEYADGHNRIPQTPLHGVVDDADDDRKRRAMVLAPAQELERDDDDGQSERENVS